jgi:hypothetical protein
MMQSHVIEIDGAFVGAAIRLADGYRFVAVDTRLDALDGQIWPSLVELRRKARVTFLAQSWLHAEPARAHADA